MFGIQKTPIYGTYGEFSIGTEENCVRAQFLMTKMKPGSEGNWENTLASHMVPWREVFNVEELTFDELLQRDLDDSRVAHDLIPYLMGESGSFAKFFPPILAVLVPRKKESTGIQSYYPNPLENSSNVIAFGDLFDFQKMQFPDANGKPVISPLGEIKYNQQKTAFIIADGQHRAMAILALHRQINDKWSGNNYAAFYNHLEIDEEQIRNIELPICVVFFPDLHEGNTNLIAKGLDLKSVCREIFLVVNKNAKPVSQSRELLLDDEDIAARMMRETLSKLKGRGESDASLARIYSFAFGDSVSEGQHRKTEVVAGQLEFTTAVALHKMHAAATFGVPDAFKLEDSSDITDGRRTQNSARPTSILLGTDLEHWNKLSRFSGKYHSSDEMKVAVSVLSPLVDDVIIPLFDKYRPFSVHNTVIRKLRTRLQDPDRRSDPIQSKCYSLLFEGSGVRSVFEEHIKRLKETEERLGNEGKELSDYVRNQLDDAQTTSSALKKHEERIKYQRAANFLQLNYGVFFEIENPDDEQKQAQKLITQTVQPIFSTISTQAFQLGYLMLVHSVAELMLQPEDKYEKRIETIKFIVDLFISGMNSYFSEDSEIEHRTITGLIREPRIHIFSSSKIGLRGLLAESIREINERQWVFFRYALLEILHSKYSIDVLKEFLDDPEKSELSNTYKSILPSVVDSLFALRKDYCEQAVRSHLNSSEFKQQIQILQARLSGEGKNGDEIDIEVQEVTKRKREEIEKRCDEHIKASMGEVFSKEKILTNLGCSVESA